MCTRSRARSTSGPARSRRSRLRVPAMSAHSGQQLVDPRAHLLEHVDNLVALAGQESVLLALVAADDELHVIKKAIGGLGLHLADDGSESGGLGHWLPFVPNGRTRYQPDRL